MMMDYEKQNDGDILHSTLQTSLEKSSKLLHKKAIVLIKSLKDQMGAKNTTGFEGLKNYIKNLLNLIDIIYNKLSNTRNYPDTTVIEEDVKNSEVLIFSLAICIKQIQPASLRNIQILEQIISSVEKIKKISTIKINFKIEIKKYIVIIAEKLLLTRNATELENENDLVTKFFSDIFFTILEESCTFHLEDLQKCLAKSLSKILKNPNVAKCLKMTFVLQIKVFLMSKIRIMDGKDMHSYNNTINELNFQNENKIKQITISESESLLKFLCSILQFLPFESINELILELTELIIISENKYLLLNSLLCFEVAFNTKNFALETSEKIIKHLLNKDFFILLTSQEEDSITMNNFNNQGINSSLSIAFIKSISQVLLNLSKVNILIAINYLNSVISLLGEFLSSNDELLKNSVFNSLQNLFNNILNKKNINVLYRTYFNSKTNDDDPNELSLEINFTNKMDNTGLISVFENICHSLLYLTSDRFDDVKPGFNLLYNFIEKITAFEENQEIKDIQLIIENVLFKLLENEKLINSQIFKIFIGKLFNIINSSLIIKIIPLQILDFDICDDNFTDNSKVWLISYIDKFLKNENIQNLKEFYDSFFINMEEIEKVLLKLKNSEKKKVNEQMIIESDEDKVNQINQIDEDAMDEDEKFQINKNESKHLRNIKIKRYELILQQLWLLCLKFTNWNENYNLYITELFKKFEIIINSFNKDSFSIFIPNIKETIFKIVCKMINYSFKHNDIKSLEIIKKDGKFFFSKSLNLILQQKVSGSEMKECFNLIANFCKILSEKFLYKIICEMIEKFDKNIFPLQNDNLSNVSNKAKFNQSLTSNEELNDKKNNKNNKGEINVNKEKEINLLSLRIEIINYILKNIKSFSKDSTDFNIFHLLNTFFEKFFFNEKLNFNIRKKLMDLFMLLIKKIEQPDQIIEIFSKFINEFKGLEYLSAKQKSKIFEFLIEHLIKKYDSNTTEIDISECFSQLHILIEIVSLTKDMNRKVRNSAYDMIGQITDFMCNSNFFNEWIKMIMATLASSSAYLKSASINAIARIFWQKRNSNDVKIYNLLNDTSAIILLFIKDNNKEIMKSIFLFVRVLLYINKDVSNIIPKIMNSIFIESSQEIKKEFKVKIRNLLKNLILKFSYEEIKKYVPKEVDNLLIYINKHIVKKIHNITKEEEKLYGDLDNSVMMDNDENLLDEEEEYIQKEFNKIEKRKNEEDKLFTRIEKMYLDEDDPELANKNNEPDVKGNDNFDKIEQLFKKDKIELDNFFYVNPYAYLNNNNNNDKKKSNEEEKEGDVYFDKKKGKIIVKELNYVKKAKNNDSVKVKPDVSKDIFIPPKQVDNLLNKKRTQNVQKDKIDLDSDEDVDVRLLKKKMLSKKGEVVKKDKKSRASHIVKFSGDEYKNSSANGDRLISGKYEPFAYIQLNPKTSSNKRRTEPLKLFEKIMHPAKK